MKTWEYEELDVLIIEYKGKEQVARIARFEDSLDNGKSLFVNLRVSDGQRWGQREIRIQPSQIKGQDKDWYARQEREWKESISHTVDVVLAKLTPEQRQRLFADMGISNPRSPIDILIDRATGRE